MCQGMAVVGWPVLGRKRASDSLSSRLTASQRLLPVELVVLKPASAAVRSFAR